MAQLTIRELVLQADRLGLRHLIGPLDGNGVDRVESVDLEGVGALARGTLAVVAVEDHPAPYRIDVALRQASARGLAGLVVTTDLAVSETARMLAERGGVPLFSAPGAHDTELVVAIDRVLAGGASESMTRAAYAMERATAAAADGAVEDILAAAGGALGTALTLVQDPTATWTDPDAVCVGEVPIGRLVAAAPDPAVAVALPVIATLASRAAQRRMRDRFAPTQSRADLIVELVLAESSRVDSFVGQAARLGFPLPLSHAAAWLTPSGADDARPPRSVESGLELFALQLFEGRPEMWHVAFVQQDMLIVCTEDVGAGDHQRRLREVAAQVKEHAATLAGDGWTYTLGLGTPQLGATGLRQSAAEARIAADSAIAAGRPGGIELTDVTGLRRVLLDLYASPISRSLLHDVLAPLDALDPDRATTAVRTLLAYLAHRNSLAQAGLELSLHPNAVGYRLKRIRSLLQLDLDDPDTRFAVELACRVRLLATGRL